MKAKMPPSEALNIVRNMDDLTITPELAALVLECDPQKIRVQAERKPELLGFPVIRVCNRTKIPRLPFLAHLGYKEVKTSISHDPGVAGRPSQL